MITKTRHKINAIAPRLSDEDPDPIEQDDAEGVSGQPTDGWLPWDSEDIVDIRNLITTRLPPIQRFVMESFLDGLDYTDINVTEKYWRYYFTRSIEFIKKELKV